MSKTVEKFSKLREILPDVVSSKDFKKYADALGISESYTRNMIAGNFKKISRGTFDTTVIVNEKMVAALSDMQTPIKTPVAAAVSEAVVENRSSSKVVEMPISNVVSRKTLEDTYEITVPDVDPNFVSFGCAPVLKKVLASGKFAPVFITGDTGNGKTMSVEQVCAKTNRQLVMFNVTNETCEEDLIGSETLIDGNIVWNDGPVLRAMRTGSVLLLDELDQGTSRVMCLQTVLQGKPYYVKKTGETVKAEAGFTVVATGNTKGLGDDDGRYVGAQIMNEAFLERFPIMVNHDYPTKAVETKIISKVLDDSDFADKLVTWAQASREAHELGALDSLITTRRLVQIVGNYDIFGDKLKAIRYGVERFSDDVRDTLIDMYTKIDANVDPSTIFATEENEDVSSDLDWS
jgi:hypothetical protein